MDGADDETVAAALTQMKNMAAYGALESQLEGMILAKGYEDCIVYLSDGSVSVVVSAPEEGLSRQDVAKIRDIICSETSYTAAELRIVEVKS